MEGGGWDPLSVHIAAAARAAGIELGTFVMGIFPRHPLVLAAQALTTQAAVGGRLALGIGPSHRWVVEQRFGMAFDRPAHRVGEYLDVLGPVLRGEDVDVPGTTVVARGGVQVSGVAAPQVLVAAHGPRMLALAGERPDGAITVVTSPELVESYVVPTVLAGAAGRVGPRVVVGVHCTVTSDPDAARAHVAEEFDYDATMPSYRATLDRQGAAGPADVMLAGDEAVMADGVRRFAEAGVTDFVVHPVGPVGLRDRTVEVFGALARG
jgi:F420-dependent oxidoreductase-like protein